MHQRSLFVKENVAASAQKLALSALFLLREQISTPSAPSELPFPQRFAHCVHHFEKMLYDVAQLARVYLHAWQVTDAPFFRSISEETLDYVMREMTDPDGGFYSTQDADSEGEEGKFFVWAPDETRDVPGADADQFMTAYGVTRHGNFEGKSILEFVGDIDQRSALAGARRKLFEAREQRVHPVRDEKVLTSWNGLMLAAFIAAARPLDPDGGSRPLAASYRQVAERSAEFLLRALRKENGPLLHSWKDGDARLNGYPEDYAYLVEGLLELYQSVTYSRTSNRVHPSV